MTSPIIAAFSGSSSVLKASFFPDIMLDVNSTFNCALLDLFIHGADDINKIKNSNFIRIECDIVSGSYINGERSHTIHQFTANSTNVKGDTLALIPKHICYLPIKNNHLRSIQITIVDKKGELIVLKGEINCRIIIKRENSEN